MKGSRVLGLRLFEVVGVGWGSKVFSVLEDPFRVAGLGFKVWGFTTWGLGYRV